MKEPEILFEDRDIIVAVKPAGMASQPDRTLGMDMVNWLRNYRVSTQAPAPGMPQVNVIHRLDRPVGGVMIYAKNDRSAAGLSRQLQRGTIYKEYIAVLTGVPGGAIAEGQGTAGRPSAAAVTDYAGPSAAAVTDYAGPSAVAVTDGGGSSAAAVSGGMIRLEDYIVRGSGKNVSRIASSGEKGAQKAVLEYELAAVREADGYAEGQLSLARIHLLTGRHHQIRLQMAHAGAGIWGDTKYNPVFSSVKGSYALALFAHRLEFDHPSTGKRMSFKAQLPESITQHFPGITV